LGVSVVLDPEEEEGRLHFLLDFRELGGRDFAVVGMVG
jgi:hypothetical protein